MKGSVYSFVESDIKFSNFIGKGTWKDDDNDEFEGECLLEK